MPTNGGNAFNLCVFFSVVCNHMHYYFMLNITLTWLVFSFQASGSRWWRWPTCLFLPSTRRRRRGLALKCYILNKKKSKLNAFQVPNIRQWGGQRILKDNPYQWYLVQIELCKLHPNRRNRGKSYIWNCSKGYIVCPFTWNIFFTIIFIN